MESHKIKFLNPGLFLGLLLAPLIWCLTPSVALAYDFNAGTQSLLSTVKTVVVIAVLIVAILSFIKKEMSKAIAAVAIGAVILAVANVDEIVKLGKGIIGLISGE